MAAAVRRRRWLPNSAAWSLRRRLLAALLVLLLAVCLAVAAVSDLALRTFLIGRLDAQLLAAGDRSSQAYDGPRRFDGGGAPSGPGGPSGPSVPGAAPFGFLAPPGQAQDTLTARVIAGSVAQAGVITGAGAVRPIPPAADGELARLAPSRHPVSRFLPGLGRYRLIAVRQPDGDVLVTGLPLAPVVATATRLLLIEAVVIAIGIGAATAAGLLIVRLALRPLDRVTATATRVSRLPLERGEVALAERVADADTNPATEVGRVGAALNTLLGHVAGALEARQASETRLRQFVADASHELRTPLASIRGYAELPRRHGLPLDPEVGHALGRVESEAARMTVLVEDLLLLARLDAGRPLAREPVDLSALVAEAVSGAHVAGPGHIWRLELPADPVVALGDPARLHQVISNLLANARAHTPTGTVVHVGLRADGAAVHLSVVDDGPGIPAELLPHVFERFARGDGSRSRSGGGTGLGLSIVAAVVAAHHGDIEVSSRPGRTAFAVALPAQECSSR